MKNLKTIIIAGVILVVFIIASIVVIHLPDHSNDQVEADSAAESASSETVYVISRDFDTLERFTVVPTDREVSEDTAYAYASEELDVKITQVTDEKGSISYEYDAKPDPGKFEYDTSKFRSMMYTLTSISAIKLVEEDAKDLAVYGLDKPTATIKTYFTDGSEVDIIIGSQAPVDENYYCMTSESNTVYTIGSYVDSLLVRRPIEYRDITLFPAYTEDDVYDNINWVKLTERNGDCLEVLMDPEQSNEYNTEGSRYVMLQPYQVSGNDTTIQNYILDVVSTLTLGTIIEDISEDQLANYGLNNPAKLEMTDIAGNSIALLIGNTCPNPDYTYCMIEGTDTLITCNSSAFGWMGLSYVQLMLRSVWTYDIEQLQGIDIDIDGQKFDIEVEHYTKKNANGNDADAVTGTLNGEKIEEETNVRRLYIKCLYFRIIGNLTVEEKKEFADAPVYGSITLHLAEDGDHTLELIRMTDRKYAMRVDGVMEYYCYKKNITSLLNALQYVQEGDVLDFNFD
ncbi:MAG: DUF4340 domain-containing protein [Oscillospiraceae bacterium]|nr:DUF4340 domain-containing protein [Oscillospiraceae bacterium]